MVGGAELRSKWRAWVSLGILLGLVCGAVMAAAAGARRTDRAYPDFLRGQRAADTIAYTTVRGGGSQPQTGLQAAQMSALPQVADAAILIGFAVTDPSLGVGVNPDGHLGTTINRFKLLAGRRPDPDRPDEALVGFLTAERLGLRVGSSLVIHFISEPTASPAGSQTGSGTVQPIAATFRVVGIEAAPGEFPPTTYEALLPLLLSPAFSRTPLGQATLQIGDAVMVRLRNGPRDLPAFNAALQIMAGKAAASSNALAPQSANVQRSIHLQAVGLWLVAALGALVGLLVVVQLTVRQISLSASDHPSLRGIGMSTGQLWVLALLGPCLVAIVGTLVGMLVAIGLSPLMPIGVARIAELHPGLAADGLVLGLGAAVTLMGVVGMTALPAWVVAARTSATSQRVVGAPLRPSRVGEALGQLGLPPTASTGARMALEPGRGRTAVPVRTSIVAVTVSLVAVGAALTFVASSTHLLATPRLYGVTYDVDIQSGFTGGSAAAIPLIEHDPNVADLVLANSGAPLQVGGVATRGEDIVVPQGSRSDGLWPPVVEGRLPVGSGEIALGGATMRAAGVKVGDDVAVSIAGISPQVAHLRVVGQVVLPPLADEEELGRGAVFSEEALPGLVPAGFNLPTPTHLLVRFAPGVARGAALARLSRETGNGAQFALVGPGTPTDLVNFGRVRALPLILAALIGALAVGTLAHLLVTSVRRKRRELAILRAIGFLPRQVRAAVGWEATSLAAVALTFGLPFGIVAGRWAWRLLADQLGVVPDPQVPVIALLAAIPATVIVANAVAALPAFLAGRLEVADALRDE